MTTPLVLGSGCGSSSSENTPGSTSSTTGTRILQVALEPVVELVLVPSTPVWVCDSTLQQAVQVLVPLVKYCYIKY
jgi:hypothetical protein